MLVGKRGCKGVQGVTDTYHSLRLAIVWAVHPAVLLPSTVSRFSWYRLCRYEICSKDEECIAAVVLEPEAGNGLAKLTPLAPSRHVRDRIHMSSIFGGELTAREVGVLSDDADVGLVNAETVALPTHVE